MHNVTSVCVCVAPTQGDLLLTGSWDGTAKLWQCTAQGADDLPIAEYYDHESEVKCLSLSQDANSAVVGADDGKVIIYDTRTDGPVETVQASRTGAAITGLQWAPDGESVVGN